MNAFKTNIQHWFSKAFHLPLLQNNRLQWVDYLKGIAIILIVYRHVLIGIERHQISVPEAFVDANMIFYSFRMPLFFILAGLFISKSVAKRGLNSLLWNKFELLLYPYLIWAFLQITLQILLSGFTNSDRTLIDYTYIIYQPRGLDQFWYLPALFNTTVVYLLVKTKLKAPIWAQLLLGLSFYFLSPYFQAISMISDWMSFYLFFALGDAISRLFFEPRFQNFLKDPLSLLLVLPLFIALQFYYLEYIVNNNPATPEGHSSRLNYLSHATDQLKFLFIALVGCFSMFILAFRLQSLNILSFLRVVGFHSLYIYVMHVIITAFIRFLMILFIGVHNPLTLLFTCIAFGVVLPIVFYNLLIKNNVFWFLFTYRKPEALKKKAEAPAAPAPLPAPPAPMAAANPTIALVSDNKPA